tara:strand:- start:12327 stop:12932 length:606 start_codon:yes stop_codon:yes gene_type:complete
MHPIVLAITGASALVLGERSIMLLLQNNYNVSLILSKGAYQVSLSETGQKIPIDPIRQEQYWRNRLNVSTGKLQCHKWNDHSADIASGSFKTEAMVIVPCSMGTLGRISSGYSLDLIERCADVHLKEGRKLIVSPRESPLSIIHLKNMIKLVEAGAKIIPPIPAWYMNPQNIDDMVDFMVVRLFDSFLEDLKPINRWSGNL